MEAGRDTDRLIALRVFGWKVDGSSEYYTKNESNSVPTWLPFFSTSLDDAMTIVNWLNLFEKYALHRVFGTFTQKWAWHVSKIDERGVLQGFAYAETPALAICMAALKVIEERESNV